MPNLHKILEEHPEIRAAITQEDGCIYGLPSGGGMGTGATGSEIDEDIGTIPQFTMINKAWLDHLGLPIPTTTQELHDTLVAFIENDMSATFYGNAPGTTIGISCGYDQWCWGLDIFYAAFGFTTWSDVCRDLVLREDGTAEFLSVTSACGNPAALLKFYDMWYDGEIVMQLNYAPIGVFYTGQDENGQWISITDEEAKAQFGKSSGELKAVHEVYGPKLILSEYYAEVFHMEQRAMDRLNDLVNYWYNYCDTLVSYPGNANFTNEELEVIDRYKVDFERYVAEQEALWLKNGGPTDEEWQEYLDTLINTCGMNELLDIYQTAYNRYASNAE